MKLDYHEKLIETSTAVAIVTQAGREQKISEKKLKLLEAYLYGMPSDENGCLRLDQVLGLLGNLREAIKHADAQYLTRNRGFKIANVPNVVECVQSPQYANQRDSIWQSTLDNLVQIHHGKTWDGTAPCIIVLSGAAGTGKSETTWLSAFYTLLLLHMLHDPHVEFAHNPGSWIVFVCQGIRESTTKDALFDKLQYAIDASPWFQENAPRRKDFNLELQWPKKRIKVINLTGQFNAGLGKDVFWAGLTEVNEMPIYSKSKRLVNTDKTQLDVGQGMFTTIMNRLETRFSQVGGGFPGKLIVDSARSHVGDFTDRMKEKAKKDKRILIIEKTVWDAQAHKYPANEPRFLVELGDDHRPPRIIPSLDRALDPELTVTVPERHRQRFEEDLEQALKDFVGIPTHATGRFIPFPEKITAAQVRYVESYGEARPFKYEEISLLDMFGEIAAGEAVDWSKLINYSYFDQILNKTVPFAAHVDCSLTQDATGFAFGRIVDSKYVAHAHVWDAGLGMVREMESIEAPVYQIDGILRIIARPGETIDITLIEGLIVELKRLINIKYVGADWFEAMAMILNMRRAGIIAEKFSVDVKPLAHFEFKHALRDDRLIMQPHKVNDKEARALKRISATHAKIKIDHPEGGSKDVNDAVVAVMGILSLTEGLQYYKEVERETETDSFGQAIDEDDGEDWTPRRRRHAIMARGGA